MVDGFATLEQIKTNDCNIAKSFSLSKKQEKDIEKDFRWSKSLCDKAFSIKN
jgi:hypothetical protein